MVTTGEVGIYGRVARPAEQGWGEIVADTAVIRLSQEHGIVRGNAETLSATSIGDMLWILLVHACLTANLLRDLMQNLPPA